MTEQNVLSAYESATLYDALKIVVEALCKRQEVTEEVQKIMGGKILEFSMDKVFNEGREEGREEGRKEGREEAVDKLITLFSKLIAVGRADDINKCKNDKAFLNKLYEEFQIA